MDRAFAGLASLPGGLVAAAEMCASTPADELGLRGRGRLMSGAEADLVVLDRELNVRQTWVGGAIVFNNL
jgi:N-acetylglucosamine-6-phosphate deacetylase